MSTLFDVTDEEKRKQLAREAVRNASLYAKSPNGPTVTQFMGAQLGDALPKLALAIPQLPYIAGVVGDVLQGKKPQPMTAESNPIAYPAAEASRAVTDFFDKLTGLRDMGVDRNDPTTYDKGIEYAAYAGNALIPFGVATKLAQSPNLGTRLVGKTAEIALPTTARYTVPNVVANATIPIAVDKGVEALSDKAQENARTQSQPQTTVSTDASTQPKQSLGDAQVDNYFASMQKPATTQPQTREAVDPQVQSYLTQQALAHDDEVVDKIDKFVAEHKSATDIATGLAAVASAVGALRLGKSLITPKLVEKVGEGVAPASPFTSVERGNAIQRATQSMSEFTDDTKRVTHAVGNLAKKAGAKDDYVASLRDAVDTKQAMNTRYSLSERINDFKQTGEFPSSSITTTPYNALRDAARALPADKWKQLGDALDARDRLDDLNMRGIRDAQLELVHQKALADPQLAPLMNAYNKLTQDVLRYVHSKGMIDADVFNKLRTTRANFVHRIDASTQPTGVLGRVQQSLDDAVHSIDADRLTADIGHDLANIWERRGDDTINEIVHPIDSLEQYLHTVIRGTHTNAVKRDIYDLIDMMQRQAGAKIAVPVAQLPKSGRVRLADGREVPVADLTVEFRRNGKVERIAYGDVALAKAMQYSPRVAKGLFQSAFNVMRKVKQDTVTLPILNPLFAIAKAPLIDAHLATAFKDKRLNYGLIDEVTRRAFGTAANLPDPTVHGFSAAASLYNAYMNAAHAAHNVVTRAALDRTSVLGKLYNAPVAGKWVRDTLEFMSNTYLKSVYRELRSEGAITSRALHSAGRGPIRALAESTPVVRQLTHAADVIADIVQTSHQTAVALQNYGRASELGGKEALFNAVKGMYGDYSRQGNNAVAKAVAMIAPWGNIGMRTADLVARRSVQQPLHTLVGVASTALAAVYAELMWDTLSPAHREFYANIAERDKADWIYVPTDDTDPTQFVRVPTDPLTSPYVNTLAETYKYAFNLKRLDYHDTTEDHYVPWRIQHAFIRGLESMFSFPLLDHYLATQGYRTTGAGMFSDEGSFYKIEDSASPLRDPFDVSKRYAQGDIDKFTWNLVEDMTGVAGRLFMESHEGAKQAGNAGAINEFAHAYTKSSVTDATPRINSDYVDQIRTYKEHLRRINAAHDVGTLMPQKRLAEAAMQSGVPLDRGIQPKPLADIGAARDAINGKAIGERFDDALKRYDDLRVQYDAITSKRGKPHERDASLRVLVPQINAAAREALDAVRSYERVYGKLDTMFVAK